MKRNDVPKYIENQIQIKEKLGSGYFSEVFKGTLKK